MTDASPDSPTTVAEAVPNDEIDRSDVVRALEIAAILGTDGELGEWNRACLQFGLTCDERLLDQLVEGGWLEREEDHWRFAHPELREEVRQRAMDQGRARRIHAACARALYEHHPVESPDAARRRAAHLMAAEKLEAALDPLLVVEQHAFENGEYIHAGKVLDQYVGLLDALQADHEDARRGMSLWRRGRLLYTQGKAESAVDLLRDAEAALPEDDVPDERGRAALHLGRVFRDTGQPDDAREKLREAVRNFGIAGDTKGLAQSRASLGMVHMTTGDFAKARELFETALETYRDLDEHHMVGSLLIFNGLSWHNQGNREQAAKYAKRARELAQRKDDVVNEAATFNLEGELARESQEPERARTCYRRAAELYERVGSRNEHIMRYNLSLTGIEQGEFDTTDTVLEDVEDAYRETGLEARLPLVYSARLVCAAGMGEFERAAHLLDVTEESLAETGTLHRDVIELVERAVDLLDESGPDELLGRIRNVCDELDARLQETTDT